MKKVNQTTFGFPGGNCQQACLASMFDLNLNEIPRWGVRSGWYEQFSLWCIDNLGLQPIDIDISKSDVDPVGYYIINGKSKNGNFWHSVVGCGGKVVHDPHPNGALKNKETYTVFLKVIQ